MTLPPAPLFGSLAYQLGLRSFKSWRWRLTTWRLFTPRQKKGQLISVHLKGALVATIRSASDEGTRQECRNIGSMKCNFSVTFIKSLNQSSIKPCLIKNWMRNTVISMKRSKSKLISRSFSRYGSNEVDVHIVGIKSIYGTWKLVLVTEICPITLKLLLTATFDLFYSPFYMMTNSILLLGTCPTISCSLCLEGYLAITLSWQDCK